MSGFLFDGIIHQMHGVLDVRQAQHALTSANLANAETPGYRAKSLDFEAALQDVFDAKDAKEAALRSPESHIEEIEPAPWAADGNSVMPERETARLQANALMYSAVSRGLSRRLAMLRYAADDGR